MATRNKHILQLCLSSILRWKQHVRRTLLPLLPQSPGPSFPQRELQCVPTSSLILVIGYCGLCPISSKPGLVEHLNSMGSYTLEFCSSLSSSPSTMLPPLRYYEFTPWGSPNFSVVINWWHPLLECESILETPGFCCGGFHLFGWEVSCFWHCPHHIQKTCSCDGIACCVVGNHLPGRWFDPDWMTITCVNVQDGLCCIGDESS